MTAAAPPPRARGACSEQQGRRGGREARARLSTQRAEKRPRLEEVARGLAAVRRGADREELDEDAEIDLSDLSVFQIMSYSPLHCSSFSLS